ncbi:MAG: diaminopimelate epimerase [Thiohalocapsa sp.]|jgi:diaminopimelate epimerase
MRFTKMHGLGNDFVVIDAIGQPVAMTPALSRRLADRRFGIGCDQVLLVEPARLPGTDLHYRIFNADGSEVEQCGNGARCFARYVRDHGLSDRDEIRVGTAAGVIVLRIETDGQVSVDMGAPRLAPQAIPFVADHRADSYGLVVDGTGVRVGCVSMGNPHAVLRVDAVERAPIATLGPALEHHDRFPKRVNAGFMEIVDAGHIRLRVWERGAGETLACGTGACAAVVIGRLWGELDERVRVTLPGGDLVIEWPGEGANVTMTGPATTVFEGDIRL